MKQISIVFILVLSLQVFLYSCKKETPVVKRLDEKWQLEKIVYDYYNLSGELNYSDSESNRSGSYILLYADMKFDLFYERHLTQGTYTLGNNLLNLSYLKSNSTGVSKDTIISYTITKKTSSGFSFYSEKTVPSGKEKASLYFLREY